MNTVILNGSLDNDRGLPCTVGFDWGITTGYGTTVVAGTNKRTGATFSYTLAMLTPGQTYHYRAWATNVRGTGYGANVSVIVPALTVQTLEATGVTDTQATVNGLINGPADVSFEWGETMAMPFATPWRYSFAAFNESLTDLTPDHIYYFRARGRTYDGSIIYGITRAFVTVVERPGPGLLRSLDFSLLLLEDRR